MSHDRGFKWINNSIACYVHRPHGISSVQNGWLGGSVATELLNMSPHLLRKKTKNSDKETKFKSPNTSKFNA